MHWQCSRILIEYICEVNHKLYIAITQVNQVVGISFQTTLFSDIYHPSPHIKVAKLSNKRECGAHLMMNYYVFNSYVLYANK